MGAIISSSVVSLGSGYSAGDVLVVNQAGNHGATIAIITVNGSGVPLTYYLPEQSFNSLPYRTNRGCGYSVQNNVPTLVGGPGVGFIINILAVGPGSDATHGLPDSLSIDPPGAPGSGYAVGDTGYFTQGINSSGCYRIASASGGIPSGIALDSADGYALGLAICTRAGPQTGSGSGLILDINDIFQCGFGAPSGYRNRTFGGPSQQ